MHRTLDLFTSRYSCSFIQNEPFSHLSILPLLHSALTQNLFFTKSHAQSSNCPPPTLHFPIIESIHFSTHQEMFSEALFSLFESLRVAKHNTSVHRSHLTTEKRQPSPSLSSPHSLRFEFCAVSITEKSNFPFCQLYNGFPSVRGVEAEERVS
jgi:hypothetical protein